MSNDLPFHLIWPEEVLAPILVSCPHSGTEFPEEIKEAFIERHLRLPEDTDWYVDKIYSFVTKLGLPLLSSRFSRYVVDLNRNPQGQKLYNDQRLQTFMVPTETFSGQPIYKNITPDQNEISRRKQLYYDPYHEKVEEILQKLKKTFGWALLFEAHSIRRYVPKLHTEAFPDLILGDRDGTSAGAKISQQALSIFEKYDYNYTHNFPFKGGYLTLKNGDPQNNMHALQLEMSQDIYMDEHTLSIDPQKSDKLLFTLKDLIESLAKMNEEIG